VGWFFIVDRATGKLIRKSDPYVAFSKNALSQPTKAGVDMLPAPMAALNGRRRHTRRSRATPTCLAWIS